MCFDCCVKIRLSTKCSALRSSLYTFTVKTITIALKMFITTNTSCTERANTIYSLSEVDSSTAFCFENFQVIGESFQCNFTRIPETPFDMSCDLPPQVQHKPRYMYEMSRKQMPRCVRSFPSGFSATFGTCRFVTTGCHKGNYGFH